VTVSQPASAEPGFDPVLLTAKIISGKWTLLVLRDLANGLDRFSALERSLTGISPKTLSERLKSLEKEGILTRRVVTEGPPRVEYTLTPRGQELIPLINAMRAYGTKWLLRGEAAAEALPDHACQDERSLTSA
jgi:DNA-binding HxlR family transcriptional regulator